MKENIQNICLKVLICVRKVFEKFIYIIGPIFFIVAVVLISGCIYIHYAYVLPYYQPYFSIGGLCHLIMSIYITICIAYNYFMAVFSSPGVPLSSEEMKLSEQDIQKLKDTAGYIVKEGSYRWCFKCDKPKPPRAHHCHVCGTCVLKFDHHCPWVANCVGHKNHHFFVLFLFWLWLGCLYTTIMGIYPFGSASDLTLPFRETWLVTRGSVIFAFILAGAVTVALTLMLFWQVYLLFSGQTTVEFYYNSSEASRLKKKGKKFMNPYDLGMSQNFQIFFATMNGRFWFSWLMPQGITPVGDGSRFHMRETIPV